jgi:hypothetical protein
MISRPALYAVVVIASVLTLLTMQYAVELLHYLEGMR